jgi:predicted transcriptional regulator
MAMKTQHILRNRKQEFIKPVLEALFVNQGLSLKDTIVLISSRLNISTKTVENLIKRLYRNGFLIISRDKYAFTLEGNFYLLSILDSNLKKGEVNES